MKSRCSFILKALTALVLALVLLFGTVSTSLAAEVESADTGANVELSATGYVVDDPTRVYFDNSVAQWNTGDESGNCQYFYAAVVMDSNNKRKVWSMTKIGNTQIYYARIADSTYLAYDDMKLLFFCSNSSSWAGWSASGGNRLTDIQTYSVIQNGHYTNTYGLNLSENKANVFRAESSNNGANLTRTVSDAGIDDKPNTFATFKNSVSSTVQLYNPASDEYENNTDSLLSLTAQGYYWKNDWGDTGTNWSTGSANTNTYASDGKAVVGSNFVLRAYSLDSKYTFDGWYDSDGNEITSSVDASGNYDTDPFINTKAHTQYYARISETMHTITLVNATAVSTTAGGVTTGTATVNIPLGQKFTGWTISDPSKITLVGCTASDRTITFKATAAITITAGLTAITGPYLTDFTNSNGTIHVGETSALSATVHNAGGVAPTMVYDVYTDAGCVTPAAGDQCVITDNTATTTAASATFRGLKPGTYYIKASISGSADSDYYITAVNVAVADPSVDASITPSALTVNSAYYPSETPENEPDYWDVEYALDDAFETFSNEYIVIEGDRITAIKPCADNIPIYYRMKTGYTLAGVDTVTYITGVDSFDVTVATPSIAYSYPNPSASFILTEDTNKTAVLSSADLATYGLSSGDVVWSVVDEYTKNPNTDDYDVPATGNVLSIDGATGAITPMNAGHATIRATARFNSGYKDVTFDRTVVVESADLTVTGEDNKALTVKTHFSDTDAEMANDYDPTATFTVTSETAGRLYSGSNLYGDVVLVKVQKQNSFDTSFTINNGPEATLSFSTSTSETVTLKATAEASIGSHTVYVCYYVKMNGEYVEVSELRRTITFEVEDYNPNITIYLNDGGKDLLVSGQYIAVYVWSSEGDGFVTSDGDLYTVGDGGSDDLAARAKVLKMVKIGTVNNSGTTENVYAQTFSKLTLIGAKGTSQHKLLFNGNYVWFWDSNLHKSDDVTPPAGTCFADYTYFKLSNGATNANQKYAVTQYHYGELKPAAASLDVEKHALPNGHDSKLNFTLTPSTHTGTDAATITGWFKLTTTPSHVIVSNNDTYTSTITDGSIKPTTNTAHVPVARGSADGRDDLSGKLYYTAAGVLENPIIDGTADAFIATAYSDSDDYIRVVTVNTTVHHYRVKLDSDTYTLNEAASTSTVALGTAKTVSYPTSDLTGYEFVGFNVSFSDDGTAPDFSGANVIPNVEHTTADGNYTYTFTPSEVNAANEANITSDYNVIAIYRKQMSFSVGKSYERNAAGIIQYISTPPKTITVTRDSEKIAEYTYDTNADVTTLDAGVGTFGNCTDIDVIAGDVVVLNYSTLASSDKIANVYYYNETAATNSDGYLDNRAVFSEAVKNQRDHSVIFTAAAERSRITIDLDNKHRITFADKTGYVTAGMNYGGYYADGETVEFTVTPAVAATCTYVLSGPTLKNKADNSAVDGLTGTLDGGVITITGVMPEYDVVIDLGVITKYYLKFDTKMQSDVVGGETKIDLTSVTDLTVSAKLDEEEAIDMLDNYADFKADTTEKATSPVSVGKYVEKGSVVTYSVDMASGYHFVGWFGGNNDNSGPDLNAVPLSTETTFPFTVKENTNVWAVATRDFYLRGNFNVDSEGNATMIANATDPANWGSYILMSYDAEMDAYAYTFTSLDQKGTRTDNGNISDITASANNKIYWFKCYSDNTSDTSYTYWNKVKNYQNTYIAYNDTYNSHDCHMFVGKKGNGTEAAQDVGGPGCFEWTTKSENAGYGKPFTLYFKPSTTYASAKWWIEAARQWPDIYISGGYSHIDTFDNDGSMTVTIKTGENTYAALTSANSSSSDFGSDQSGYERQVKKYQFKSSKPTIKLSKTLDAYHEVTAFVVYDLKDDTVEPIAATNAGSNVYTAEIEIKDHNLYICPVISTNSESSLTVTFDASQLDKDEWGDLVSCYPWYSKSGGSSTKTYYPYGQFPGQLMVPSKTGLSWSAKILPSFTEDGTTFEFAGITFANYAYSTNTWLGRDVMGAGKVITTYNSVNRFVAKYNKSNCLVQTYDYREPYAIYHNGLADGETLSFAVKTGNSDYLTVSKTDAGDNGANLQEMNVLTFTSESGEKYSPHFEYLTNATGNKYTDLKGKVLNDYPTPSYYIVAKGMVEYSGGNMTKEYKKGDTYDTIAAASRPYDESVSMGYAVQWYVYDAAGNYILDTLSAAFVDTNSGMTRIAKALEDLDYAVDDKSVGISYDNPRYFSSSTSYRFLGQWYETKPTDIVTVKTRVGVFTNGGRSYELSDNYKESYGTAKVFYDPARGAEGYKTYVATDGVKNDYVDFAIGDAKNNPVYLDAENNTDFVGWYYESSGEMKKISDDAFFIPDVSAITSEYTLYAMYTISAKYIFKYLDRNGEPQSYIITHTLTSNELKGYNGNGYHAGVPTYFLTDTAKIVYEQTNPYDTAVAYVNSVVGSYQYSDFGWPTITGGSAWLTPAGATVEYNGTLKALIITAACSAPNYTVTYQKAVNMSATGSIYTVDGGVPSNTVLAFSSFYDGKAGMKYENADTNGITRDGFLYWSLDPEGNQMVTTDYSYNLLVTHDLTLYAQYDRDMPVFDPWVPRLESVSKSRLRTATADKTYLDFNAHYLSSSSARLQDLAGEDKLHYGMLISYDSTNVDYVSLENEKVAGYVKLLVNNGKSSGRIKGTNNVLTVFDYCDAAHISNLNRMDYAISGNTNDDSFLPRKLTVYLYVYDKETGTTVYLSEGKQHTVSEVSLGTTVY